MLSTSNTPNPLLATPSLFTPYEPQIKTTEVVNSACSEGGHGQVNIKIRDLAFKKLQQAASKGVKFDKNLLEKSCWGGTCSAQALRFANLFFNPKFQNLGIKERFLAVADLCKVSGLVLKSEQAALNAITEDTTQHALDFSRAKVESIVALKDFEVSYASDPIRSKEGFIAYEDFEKTAEKLPEGLFFTRLLANYDNHKKEAYGHSVLFLNSSEGCFFWDPMGNSYQLADKEVIKQLYELVGGTASRWGLEDPRFYKILPKELSPLEGTQNNPSGLISKVGAAVKEAVNYLRQAGS